MDVDGDMSAQTEGPKDVEKGLSEMGLPDSQWEQRGSVLVVKVDEDVELPSPEIMQTGAQAFKSDTRRYVGLDLSAFSGAANTGGGDD